MRVVLTAGCFDLFHVAHLRYLQNASALGDRLIVSVTMDEYVGKGPGRPVVPQEERLEIVRAIVRGFDCESEVDLYRCGIEALKKWKPDVFCKGDDWKVRGLPDEITSYCKQNGIEIAFTKPNPQTTGNIIKRLQCEYS